MITKLNLGTKFRCQFGRKKALCVRACGSVRLQRVSAFSFSVENSLMSRIDHETCKVMKKSHVERCVALYSYSNFFN